MSNLRYRLVSNVIFELDGVLLDTEEINNCAIHAITKKRYQPIAPKVLPDLFARTDTETIQMVIESTGINASSFEGLLHDYREYCKIQMPKCEKMFGITPIINHLHSHNVPIAIATTNRFHAFQDKTTNHRDIIDLFHHIVYAPDDYDVKSLKKGADLFQVCASRFPGKTPYSRCLVFESTKEGVISARRAGMQVVWITPPHVTSPTAMRYATMCIKSVDYFKPDHFGLPPFCRCEVKQ